VTEDIVAIVGGLAFIPTVLGVWFWGRGYLKKIDAATKAAPPISGEVLMRLERMEQGIDAIAMEVERISEGQRFTTKLMSERAPLAALPPSREGST
jgi:hypothetical protein